MRSLHSAFVVGLGLAACGSQAPAPLTGRATPASSAPAPAVRWTERDVATTGLPAIASDGHAVVIAHRDNDGGRGNPNLTLIEKDRGDQIVRRMVVITAGEVESLAPDQIAARFADANRWLGERHAADRLVAMTALVVDRPGSAGADTARGGGVTLRWTPSQLALELPGAAALQRTTPASWLAADRPMCNGCAEVCHNDAFLAGGHVDVERAAALVVIAYRGTDTCWEPSSQHHVVAW